MPGSSKTTRWFPSRGAVAALLLTLLLATLLVSPGAALAQGTKAPSPPKLDVKSWVLEDARTGQYLAGKNPDERRAMASTTKIMTTLVVLKKIQNLDKEVTVTPHAASYAKPPYSNVGLYPYDKVSYKELIEAALIPSGIDAAYALADNLGDGDSGRFVKMMNDQASSMGLKNTHFQNPGG
ncbi:MAG: D-alanyl-D-alanine carboxypeptidase family protein, partial [Rubrobacteraceae bacterium]